MNQLEHEKNTSNTAMFLLYNRNLRIVDEQTICNRRKKVGHTERTCRQSSYNQQHNTHSYKLPIIAQYI